MTRYLLVFCMLCAGCSTDRHESHEMEASPEVASEHASHGAIPAPVQPALGELSLYQLDTPWTDHAGNLTELRSLAGQPVLAAMTYTLCQVSCPVILADLKRIESELIEAGVDFRIVLFSLDPKRDTPEQLSTFRSEKRLSDRWVLLTAPDDQVREMAALLGVSYQRKADGEVSHSNIISVLDATGALAHQQLGLGAGKSNITARKLIEGDS